MSSTSVSNKSAELVQQLFINPLMSSSSEPPREEWSSLATITPEYSPKVGLYRQGLYNPGSGEICAKYVAMSASSILLHPYYAYPSIEDPGILDALLKPEKGKIYPPDGQELYLALCEEMKITPVRSFYRSLLQQSIDLKYYGVSSVGVRAMCEVLNYNTRVVRLDLTSSFLNQDACYHLGQLLGDNTVLQELILSGCRIQGCGLRVLVARLNERSIEVLDLSKNAIGDSGFPHLAQKILRKAVIKRLNLSYNDLGPESASLFAEVIERNNSHTHLDLSWNKFTSIKGISELVSRLGNSSVLVELNLSWCNIEISRPFRKLLTVPTLAVLNLSNNRLVNKTIDSLALRLNKAHVLNILDLSSNPIPVNSAIKLVSKLREKTVTLKNLLMDNVIVNKQFVKEVNEVLKLKHCKNTRITYGHVLHNYTLSVPDMRYIIMKRLDYVTAKGSKKASVDVALYFMRKRKEFEYLQPRDFMKDLRIAGIMIEEEMAVGLADMFPGIVLEKGGRTIKVDGVLDIVKRLWPEKKLPPTPPEPTIVSSMPTTGSNTSTALPSN